MSQAPNFPKELLENIPPSNGLDGAYIHIGDVEQRLPDIDKASHNFWMAGNDSMAMKKLVDSLQPYLQAGSNLAWQIEREIQNAPLDSPLPIQHPGASHCDTLADLIAARASLRSNAGEYDGALKDCVDAIILSIRCPLRNFNSYVENLPKIQRIASTHATHVVPSVTDPECLKRALRTLNGVEPHLFPDVSNRAQNAVLSFHRPLLWARQRRTWENRGRIISTEWRN